MRTKLLCCAAPILATLALLVLPGTSQAQWVRYGGYGRPYYSGYYYPWYSSYYYPGYTYGSPYGWSYPSRSFYYSYPTTGYYPPIETPATVANNGNGTYQSFYQGPPNADTTVARFRVRVPENARLWIENQETNVRGPERIYASPPLVPGQAYTYHLRAQWMENGQEVTRTREFPIHAGDFVTIDFLTNGATPEKPAAAPSPNPASENRPNSTNPPPRP